MPKLDRLARSAPPDTRAIDDTLAQRGIKLSLGGQVYNPADPMGAMLVNIPATFAEFEIDLLHARTKEGMAVAKANGKQPEQQHELVRMHGTREHTITDPAEVFTVSHITVYRPLERDGGS
ncbi:Resolvase, N terminal domain [Actinopolyspora xinjiangensis]|uniref:Resolvase, N terminal domain n=1 Tax=Actinopolyspora xinjiangensis TaxID=405564 RepID=A0A1H0RFZ0_9ACTN|nr:Resolvase, N terminal domain [Actinopolyspora xinjiangensis]